MASRLRLLLTIAFGLAVLAACGTEQPPVTDFELAVTVEGTGAGQVTSDVGDIDVTTGTDTATFTSGTAVTLTADPADGSVFAGWGGACTGTGLTCTVNMTAARTVTATFNTEEVADEYTLTVNVTGTGAGRVTSDVGDIDLTTGSDSAVLATGTPVLLTADPDDGSVFAGWTGACTGTELTCTVTMDGTRNVTARFNLEGTGEEVTVSYTITDTAYSAEEFRAPSVAGFDEFHTFTTSSDLDLGVDLQHTDPAGNLVSQYVGLLFTGVNVPQGAQVVSAELFFTAIATATAEPRGAAALDLTIAAENVDSAQGPFASSRGISARDRTETTTWSIPSGRWTADQVKTADVTPVIQAVIDRSGWTAQGGIVLIIYNEDSAEQVTRRALPFGPEPADIGDPAAPFGPTLRITYTTAS
jgi:uncharacterized repeat protein (TIGR02543 family)